MDSRPLKNIEKSLKEILELHKVCKEVLHDGKKVSKRRESNYDFDDFDKLDVFVKYDEENTNESKVTDDYSHLVKADIILKLLLKKLDSQRNIMFEKYMDLLHNMSEEIHAISNVCAFLEHWKNKVVKDFQLKEYPSMFKKCFDKIPETTRTEITRLLSNVKKFNTEDKSINVLNESNKDNQFDMTIISSNLEHSVLSPFGNNQFNLTESLSEDLKQRIPDINFEIYERGNTAKVGLSVLDFTNYKSPMAGSDRPDTSILTMSTDAGDPRTVLKSKNEKLHFDMTKLDIGHSGELGESILIDEPLNQTVKVDIDKIEKLIHQAASVDCELPSFLDDSTRVPNIETYGLCHDDGFDNIEISTIHASESFGRMRDESMMIEKSYSNLNLDNSVSFGPIELSTIDCDYSFNNSIYRKNDKN